MSLIKVKQELCKKCSVCSKVCPVLIIGIDADGYPSMKDVNDSRCINCGHCVAACQSQALEHSAVSTSVSNVNITATLSSKELSTYFKNRRSIRNYSSKPVPKEIIEQVMDVVRYAPTGTNSQKTKWILALSPEKVKELADGTIEWMRMAAKADPGMGGRYNFAALIQGYENGIDIVTRSAPHLAISYTEVEYPLGATDGTIAAAHLELLLPSFGLGSCWAGFLYIALKNSPHLRSIIGLDDRYTVHAALMFGYPKYDYAETPDRKEADIAWL